MLLNPIRLFFLLILSLHASSMTDTDSYVPILVVSLIIVSKKWYHSKGCIVIDSYRGDVVLVNVRCPKSSQNNYELVLVVQVS